MAGLRGAARHPTNLAKVTEILQGPTEPPSVFLNCLIDPEAEEQRASVTMAFINQAAANIKKMLQKLDGLKQKFPARSSKVSL